MSQEFIDKSGLISLEKYWVITKKYNGSTYYHGSIDPSRPAKWAHSSRWKNARNAFMYDDKATADRVCAEINANKKKLKMKVDKASNHYVSNFELQFDAWQNKLKVMNRIVSVQDLKANKTTAKTQFSNENINNVIANVKDYKNRHENDLKSLPINYSNRKRQLEADYVARIQQMDKELQDSLVNTSHKLTQLDEAIVFIEQEIKTNILAESLKTGNDDKFKLLYGKTEC